MPAGALLLFCDEPGHLDTDTIARKYASVESGIYIDSNTYKSTSFVLGETAFTTQPLSPGSREGVVGFRNIYGGGVFPLSMGTTYIEIQVLDAYGNPLISWTHDYLGAPSIRRGGSAGTVVASSSTPYMANSESRYLELAFRIGSDDGYAELRSYDESDEATTVVVLASGLNTMPGATAAWSAVKFYIGPGASDSHIYIRKGLEFLGPQRVYTCFPNGAGLSAQMTPSAGSNYQNVDDAAPDDDSTYNQSSADGDKDLYAIDDTPIPVDVGRINGVQVNVVGRKETTSPDADAVAALLQLTLEHAADPILLSTTYVDRRDCYDVNPETGLRFTRDELAACQIGQEHVV